MRGLALLVKHGQCTCAGVGELKKRGSVVRGILGVRMLVGKLLIVGSTCAREVVMLDSVEGVHFRGRGLVLAGRGCMRECHVMLLCRCVGPLVIRC